MAECPKCAAAVETDCTVCPACGCDLTQATESFEPVGQVSEESPAVAVASEGPVLIVNKGPQLGERFYLDRASLTLGRDPESDIFLNDMTVSREHARLDIVGASVRVSDLGSLNGTYVNGVCVDAADLGNGDVLQIGTFHMVFLGGSVGS